MDHLQDILKTDAHALVIGTQEHIRQIVSLLFEETGFSVLEADSVENGRIHLERDADRIHLVFIDAGSGRQATDLAQQIERTWPWIRVLISTDAGEAHSANWPRSASPLAQPWRPLDLLIEAERAFH